MSTIPTTNTLRNSSRRLDRLNADVDVVLNAMRNGATLHLEFFQQGPRWRTSAGRYVTNEVAKLVIINKRVAAVGDALFADALSQTWRYIAELNQQQTGGVEMTIKPTLQPIEPATDASEKDATTTTTALDPFTPENLRLS